MRIETLREFVELARDLDFGATAARLNLSQSALSNHIGALEKEVGFELIVRWPNRTLTPQGNLFLKYAQSITGIYTEALQKCAAVGPREHAECVRVSTGGMSPAMQRTMFALLGAYGSDHPEVRLEYCSLRTRESNIDNLLAGKVDIAFVASTSGNPVPAAARRGVACMPCLKEETSLWVSRYSFLLHGDTLGVEDLDHYRFPLMNNALYDYHKLSLETSLEAVGATPVISPYYADSFEDYVLNAFDDGDLYVANKSSFTKSSAFSLVPDRLIVPFRPAIYSASYLGRRKDEDSPAVLALYDYLISSAHGKPPLE